jgi:hypothetical protein
LFRAIKNQATGLGSADLGLRLSFGDRLTQTPSRCSPQLGGLQSRSVKRILNILPLGPHRGCGNSLARDLGGVTGLEIFVNAAYSD